MAGLYDTLFNGGAFAQQADLYDRYNKYKPAPTPVDPSDPLAQLKAGLRSQDTRPVLPEGGLRPKVSTPPRPLTYYTGGAPARAVQAAPTQNPNAPFSQDNTAYLRQAATRNQGIADMLARHDATQGQRDFMDQVNAGIRARLAKGEIQNSYSATGGSPEEAALLSRAQVVPHGANPLAGRATNEAVINGAGTAAAATRGFTFVDRPGAVSETTRHLNYQRGQLADKLRRSSMAGAGGGVSDAERQKTFALSKQIKGIDAQLAEVAGARPGVPDTSLAEKQLGVQGDLERARINAAANIEAARINALGRGRGKGSPPKLATSLKDTISVLQATNPGIGDEELALRAPQELFARQGLLAPLGDAAQKTLTDSILKASGIGTDSPLSIPLPGLKQSGAIGVTDAIAQRFGNDTDTTTTLQGLRAKGFRVDPQTGNIVIDPGDGGDPLANFRAPNGLNPAYLAAYLGTYGAQ